MTSFDHLQVKDALITHGVTLGSFVTRGVKDVAGMLSKGIIVMESDISELASALGGGPQPAYLPAQIFPLRCKKFLLIEMKCETFSPKPGMWDRARESVKAGRCGTSLGERA